MKNTSITPTLIKSQFHLRVRLLSGGASVATFLLNLGVAQAEGTAPSVSQAPSAPVAPSVSAVPNAPAVPSASTAPAAPPSEPSESSKPSEPAIPAPPSGTADTAQDAAPAGAETPAKPGETATAADSEAPQDPAAKAAAETDARVSEPAAPATDVPSQQPVDSAESGAELAADATVIVAGKVIDQQSSKPVSGASVFVFGTNIEATTDSQGAFQLEVPTGELSLAVVHKEYPTEAMIDLKVGKRGLNNVVARLTHAEQVDDFVVVGKAIDGGSASVLAARRNARTVQDALGSEDIARSADGSASAATRRIVGASIVGGQFLFVRGLGGRYSNVRLNGVPLPSTDPELPGFQLDLFPSSLLSALTITKTFTPDMPGDFAGGSLNVQTRTFPEEFMLKLTLGIGADSQTTGRRFLTYKGGASDWLGYDDGTRAKPKVLPDKFIQGQDFLDPEAGFTDAELKEVGASFSNRWKLLDIHAYPNLSFGVSVGDTFKPGIGKLGYFATLGYRSRFRRELELFSTRHLDRASGKVEEGDTLRKETGKYESQLGALATVSYAPVEDHEISVVGMMTQSGTDQTQLISGFSGNEGEEIEQRQFQWVQRQLGFGQLLGKHKNLFNRLDVGWNLNVARILRDQPDMLSVLYRDSPTGFRLTSNGGERFFSGLKELGFGGGLDAELRLPGAVTARSGYLGRTSERQFRARRFNVIGLGDTALAPEELFTPDTSGKGWAIKELTVPNDGYDGSQTLHAAYAMLDWQVISAIRISGGVRYENFNQQVRAVSPYELTDVQIAQRETAKMNSTGGQSEKLDHANRTDRDWLPSIGLTYAITEKANLRAAYGGTVARPQLREMAPFDTQDFVRRRKIIGNPELKRTLIQNFDLRWEFFPSGTEVFAVSAFYKHFRQPIESVIASESGDLSFDNIDAAFNYGAEFEARWSLGLLSKALDDFSMLANLALIRSRIVLNDEQAAIATNRERPLAGQSPFVANLSLGWEPANTGFSAFVYYNVFGRRIQDAGRNELPDVYEEPFHSLDLGLFYKPDAHWNIGLSTQNLLFQRERVTQGGANYSRALNAVTTANLNIGWTY